MTQYRNHSARLALEALEERTTPTAGTLDPSFGMGGQVVTSFSSGVDRVFDLAIQPDGKILAVGDTPGSAGQDFGVYRYTSSGQLDSSFGTGGMSIADFKKGNDLAYAVELQPDGKLVVAGRASFLLRGTWQEQADTALARYTASGKLDTTFGNKGKLTLDIGEFDYARDIALWQSKIVVAGVTSSLGYQSIFVARMNSNGSLDTTFGTGGKTILTQRTPHATIGLAVQADGKVLVTAMEPNSTTGMQDFMVARLTTGGALDASFASGGIVRTDFGDTPDFSRSIAVQSDGKIVVTGEANGVIALARYLTNGTLDTSFDGDGKALFPIGDSAAAYRVMQQPDGKMLVTGNAVTHPTSTDFAADFMILRVNTNGSLDTTFGDAGVTLTDFVTNRDYAYAATLQTDGRIVVAGKRSTDDQITDDIAIARYLGDPALQANALPPRQYATILTKSQIDSLFPAALARWRSEGADTSLLQGVKIKIADLPGTTLGVASGNTITLDSNAAGWGWFVDKTPRSDAEFRLRGNQGEQGRMDLLSVLMHEMGHVLGYEHQNAGVMQDTLTPGERILPMGLSSTQTHGNIADLIFTMIQERKLLNR